MQVKTLALPLSGVALALSLVAAPVALAGCTEVAGFRCDTDAQCVHSPNLGDPTCGP